MTVKLISVTPDAEETMAYVARVSNPANQENEKYAGLLKYCIKHNHWSVFEQSFMTLEIETTRAIAANFASPWPHIKSFPSGMLIHLCWVLIRFHYQNFVGKTQRIVKTLLMI